MAKNSQSNGLPDSIESKPLPSIENGKLIGPFASVTGIENRQAAIRLLGQAMNVVRSPSCKDKDDRLAEHFDLTVELIAGIGPKDAIEGMLATQMLAVHFMAVECSRRAMLKGQSFEGRQMNSNQAVKLMRSFAQLTETLDKHRGKGRQKITVEHVTVNDGGQAIVGSVNHGGGANPKE